jgi:hypothetical protein
LYWHCQNQLLSILHNRKFVKKPFLMQKAVD